MGNGPQNHRPPTESRLPRLLWFLGLHGAMGVAIGVVFASLVVLFNVGGLNDLLSASREPIIPMILFFGSCALTFGSANMGIAVMMLPYPPPGSGPPG